MTTNTQERLAYLREQIENECISYAEIAELQTLIPYIPQDDVLLLECAGVSEAYANMTRGELLATLIERELLLKEAYILLEPREDNYTRAWNERYERTIND